MDWSALLEEEYVAEFGILLSCALGMPVPEEITLISAGMFVVAKQLEFHRAVLAGVTGVFLSDAIFFLLGRKLGRPVFQLRIIRGIITESRITQAEACLQRNGVFSCVLGRFLPGFRIVIFATAGMLNIRPLLFLIVDLLVSIISVSLWIFIGIKVGGYFDAIQYIEEVKMIVVVGAVSFLMLYLVRQYITCSRVNV